MKRTSKMIVQLPYSSEKIWQIMTDNENYQWRSDLQEIQIISEKDFIEITTQGYQTIFHITEKKPCSNYAFDMENPMFQGKWWGSLREVTPNETELTFYEELSIKNPFIWLVSFFMMNLHKQQKLYLTDLEKALQAS